MDCRTCEQLLAAYRLSVSLFKEAVRKRAGAVGDDSRLPGEAATRLGLQCKDASDALREHWLEHHDNGTKWPGSA